MLRRHSKTICLLLGFLLLLFVTGRIVYVNGTAYRFKETVYPMEEWVPLDGDFFYTSNEDTDGYFVRVSDAEILPYEAFMQKFGFSPDYLAADSQKDVVLVRVDFKNVDNTSGGVFIRDYTILNASLSAYYAKSDLYMQLANPGFDTSSEGITVLPGTEASLNLVYTTVARADGVTFLEEHAGQDPIVMYLNISLYPTRKMVELRLDASKL